MSDIETFQYLKEVQLVDADGVPIREGSVLREINDGDQGVCTRVVRKGDLNVPLMSQIGDIVICKDRGCHRITNRYNQWRHVPRSEQTYEQRLHAWKYQKYDHDADRKISRDEGFAIDGIMSLLPEDMVNWEYGPWPERIEDALQFLVAHLSSLSPKPPKL